MAADPLRREALNGQHPTVTRPTASTQQGAGDDGIANVGLEAQPHQIPQMAVMSDEGGDREAAGAFGIGQREKSMDERQDAQALDWYGGRQSIVPVQSVLHERHYYFDDDGDRRYRACELFGIGGSECVLGGMRRSGGIVDATTGRLVLRTTTGPLAMEMAAICNGDRQRRSDSSHAGRYAVRTRVCENTGMTQIALDDTKRPTREGRTHSICWIWIDSNDGDAARGGEALLARLATELDDAPLDWAAVRQRRQKPH